MIQVWFVDVRYSWPEIAHTDRYVTCAASATKAIATVAELADTAHAVWRDAKSPPRISLKATAGGRVFLMEDGVR